MNWQDLEQNIAAATGKAFKLEKQAGVGGGCINSAMKISGSGQQWFVKFNERRLLDMFEAEADGLRELSAAQALRVPEPICTGVSDNQAYIVMEYVPLDGVAGATCMTRFGEQLAQMHHTTQSRFGWHRDNTIGSTSQPNSWDPDWLNFWRQQRLGYQVKLAIGHGLAGRAVQKAERLLETLPEFFQGYQPEASVLHGDLWSGNYGTGSDGDAVIFDPAVYFGDREADLAMTELFGGFGREFYAAYQSSWPLDAGYAQRKYLYNLYHLLNHFNLFGGGYAMQAESLLDKLLSELHA